MGGSKPIPITHYSDLLEYALNLRMHGEEPLTGSWKDWESKVEAYLREPREKYMPHNETPTIQGVKMSEQTTDLTEATPTLNPDTRKKIQKGTTIALGAVAVLLLVDDQVKRFKRRKTVKLTVVDKPDTENPEN